MNTSLGYKGFKDLECRKKARELRINISTLVKSFPTEEKYNLTSQIIRSSRSITNNIAEGYGRFTYADTKHFFIQARGSVTETIDHLIIAHDESYISKEELTKHENMCETVFKIINGYLNYPERKKQENAQFQIPNS